MIEKALIYATSSHGLLVFDEPDFPHVPIQIPGGTIEPGEDTFAAARREFHEETGLAPDAPFNHLGTTLYDFTRDGIAHTHQRHFFHVSLTSNLPETWNHIEKTPSDGSGPILFHFFWLSLESAQTRLGLDMDQYITQVHHTPGL